MNFSSKVFLFLLSIVCIDNSGLNALTVGSRTAVSVQPQITFPSAAENVMLGFAAFNQGFILTDTSTTCTFDDYFPVAGEVKLNGGSLVLKQDLTFSNTLEFYGGGTILAQGHTVKFPTSVSNFSFPTGGALVFGDAGISLNSDLSLIAPLQLKGTCKIDGNGKRLDFSQLGEIVIRRNGSLTLENIEITNLTQSRLRCMTDSGLITIRNSILHLDNYYTFSRGSMKFDSDCVITGSGNFFYTSCVSSTIASQSTLMLSDDATFYYAPECPLKNLLYFEDNSATLYLDGCSIISTRTGLLLTGGTLIVDNHVTLSSQALNLAEALVLDSSLDIRVQGGSMLDLYGCIRYEP